MKHTEIKNKEKKISSKCFAIFINRASINIDAKTRDHVVINSYVIKIVTVCKRDRDRVYLEYIGIVVAGVVAVFVVVVVANDS